MEKSTRTVALLFGRKGSVGLPGKNLSLMLGRPLCTYPLRAAQQSKRVDAVFTSTDDPGIAELAGQYGSEVIDRPAELATSDSIFEHAVEHAAATVAAQLGYEPKYAVILMCNACNILADTIDSAVDLLDQNPDYDSVATVSQYTMYSPLRARRIAEDGSLQLFLPPESFSEMGEVSSLRDSAGDTYFCDCGAAIVRWPHVKSTVAGALPFKWLGNKILPFVQEAGGADIDHAWQVPCVEAWLRRHGFSETATPYE